MTNIERISFKAKNNRIFIKEIQKKVEKESTLLILLTILHLPLGLILYAAGSLGIIHPIGIFALGMYWAVSKKFTLERIVYLIAYLIGCEVLWRMAQTPIFWEFGKYGSALIMITALIRSGYYKIPALPITFIILLFPACVLTITTSTFGEARDQISFNLSGPFFLFISCWFFSYIKFSQLQVKKLFNFIFIPLLTVATTTLFYTVSSGEIEFNTESNFATSGGFGPNQVSSMLGLGVFVGLACYLLYNDKLKFKSYFVLGTLLLAAQCVFTFSRGGIYNAIGAIAILTVFQLNDLTATAKRIPILILTVLFFLLIIFPYMNDFTGGKLEERFEDTETTRRGDIIESDIQILMENPLLGIGLGNAKSYREKYLGYSAASHTEFSRMLSEHGILGVLAILVLILLTILNLIRQNSVFGRAIIAGAVVWCALFMFNAGMRLAAPGFLWGFSFITILRPSVIPRKRLNPKKLRKKINTQPNN